MDKETIMENGLVERYVLGDLEGQEKAAVEQLLANDQEVKSYVEEVEDGLQRVALDNAIAPPSKVKDRLMMQVSDPVFMALSDDQTPVKGNDTIETKTFNWPLAVAASLALLFMVTSVWFYNQWQTSVAQEEQLATSLNEMESKVAAAEMVLTEVQQLNAVMKMPGTAKLVLIGNKLSPQLAAAAFINHEDKIVFLNTEELPKLGEAETYQMWADVEGVMINMGLVSTKEQMVNLQYIEHAESVNLTIEPAGGSDHPTVERLVANVYL